MFLAWKLFDWSSIVQFCGRGLKALQQISMDLEWKMCDLFNMVQFYGQGFNKASQPISIDLGHSCLEFCHVIGQMLKLLYDWMVHSSITKSLLLLYKDIIKFFHVHFAAWCLFTIYPFDIILPISRNRMFHGKILSVCI